MLAYLSIKFLAIRARSFEKSTLDPMAQQKKFLFECLRRNSGTEFGKKYKFKDIRSFRDFQDSVPMNDCESMRPYITKMARGETNILTKDRPIFFGATSGTTNLPKLIPTTKLFESKKAELMSIWGYYILRDHPGILKGKILTVVSPESEGRTEAGIPFGAESGHTYKELPKLVKGMYVLPDEIFRITSYNARYYSILRIAMEHNITNIATLNPKTIILLSQKIRGWQESLLSDIERGTLNSRLDMPAELSSSIKKRLRPNPARAHELRKILDHKGSLLPKFIWPDLELIECWKSGTMKLYLRELPQYFGDVPVRDIGYASTEARGSIPFSDEGSGGILAIGSNFYEFIPKEDAAKKDKRFFLAGQLEKDREYFIIVTTAGGLYRYNIDDIIKVTGFYNKTPIIEFVQKGMDATSLAGEKLYESQVDAAFNNVLERLKLNAEFFSAIAEPGGVPHYTFLVEFTEDLSAEKKKTFFAYLEHEMCLENREYQYVREAQLLGAPVLKIIRRGEYAGYRQKRLKEGAHDSQFKSPELTQDLRFEQNFAVEEELTLP